MLVTIVGAASAVYSYEIIGEIPFVKSVPHCSVTPSLLSSTWIESLWRKIVAKAWIWLLTRVLLFVLSSQKASRLREMDIFL